jgi:hypothetical protein
MATATSDRRRARRVLAALIGAASLAAAALVVAVTTLTAPARPAQAGFPTFMPASAPATWRQLRLPDGSAVLSYPPSLRPVRGDSDAVSAARVSPHGAYQLYLNATPRQGEERLAGWAAFRLRLLRSDDAATAHEVAAAQDVRFRGGTGSCVMDSYVTRIHANHFQEIACLVQGSAASSVIVAAAPAAHWAQARPLLLRAVAAYQAR